MLLLSLLAPAGRAAAGTAAKPRFEVQGNGSIDAAAATFAGIYGLTNEQKARTAELMRQRAHLLSEGMTAADNRFRQAVEPVLDENQRRQVPWPAARWTSIVQWTHHLPNLSPDQIAAVKARVDERGRNVRAALMSAQKRYLEGLQTVLAPAQYRQLEQRLHDDPVVRIAMH